MIDMIVIARNNGPFYGKFDGLKERHGLIENKEYNVISWAYNQNGQWFIETDDFINIKEPKFYIRIINENGVEHDYWNDYFLSNEEIRNIKIENLLNECTNNI